jgi:bacterioferritin
MGWPDAAPLLEHLLLACFPRGMPGVRSTRNRRCHASDRIRHVAGSDRGTRGSSRCDAESMPRELHRSDGVKGDPKVIGWLQDQLRNELTAVNQYFVHYRLFKHWGFSRMARKEYEESIGEMKHADALMERILVLDGLPNLQGLGKLLIGESLVEALGCDLKMEQQAQATIKDGMAHCESVRDYVSRDLLRHILDDTEEHIDFLETQLDLVGKVGEQNYLQAQMEAVC